MNNLNKAEDSKTPESVKATFIDFVLKVASWLIKYIAKKLIKRREDNQVKLDGWRDKNVKERNERINSLNDSVDALVERKLREEAGKAKHS